ncbi:DNA-3-methyladenine glycosylase I [Shimia haliotis]|uniref:DNA-3-methyladenine glycosylase I n=1 Tax=Shimia haliotis TaxID=1280847 RepID=A0A1I4G2G0_9RHOB|nr:DNA-3-methyladenine glycosylase I [Shimia haliotis]SFL23700.1 DNA-3-methyladenine glycosylase I [Shimia haliotis]
MRTFDDLFAISAERKGGPNALEAMLDKPKTAEQLAQIPEDRWLAQFTKGVFQAGFNWKVIENKWDGFEAAFHGFDVDRCAFMHDEDMDSLMSNKDIVRNGPKIRTVMDNAHFLQSLRESGGAGVVLGGWASTDYVNQLEFMKKGGSRIGGATGQYSLRFLGKDSFILSRDVVARLIAEGVIDKQPTSKGAMKKVQAAFNTWMDQSGRSLTEISRVLAMSV